MFDPKQFDDLAKKLFAALPSSIQNLEQDLQQKFKEVLQSAFSHLDLVTRDEFDVQTKVLMRTREKLEQIQKQVDDLITLQQQKKK